MMGRTHFKIGVLSYILAGTVPFIVSLPIIGRGKFEVGIVGACVAGVAALMADVDSQHSQVNQMNPITGTANKVVDAGEDIMRNMIRMLVTIGTGVGLIYYKSEAIKFLKTFSQISSYASLITYGAAGLFILIGILGKKGEGLLLGIPIIGDVYNQISSAIDHGGSIIKRIMMFIVYAGIGGWIIYYNYSHVQEPYLYLIGGLLIAAVTFPHRSFFHTAEGLILFTLTVSYLTKKIGYPEIGRAHV